MKKMKFLALALALFMFAASSFAKKTTPEETIEEMVTSAKKLEWGKVYDCFSKESAQGIENVLKGFIMMAAAMAKNNPEQAKNPQMQKIMELEKYSGKEFFIKLMETSPDSKKMLGEFDNYKITKKETKGDKVILTVKTATKEEPVTLIKENGEWKIDITDQLKKGPISGNKKEEAEDKESNEKK